MNTDIRLSVGFLDHFKTLKLKRELGWDAIESLLRLWFFAAQCKPDGILSSMDADDIETAAKWPGRPGCFLAALLKFRWMDCSNGVYALHDWADHNAFCVHAIERRDRAKRAAEMRWRKRNPFDAVSNAQSNAKCNADRIALSNAKCNATSNATSNAVCNAPTPTPTPKQQQPPYPPSCEASVACTSLSSSLSLSPSEGVFVGDENEASSPTQTQQSLSSSLPEEVSPSGNGGAPCVSEFINLVPSRNRKPSVEKVINRALKTHEPELIRRNIRYANEHATANYAGYLALAIKEDYASEADARASPAETIQRSIEEQRLRFESMQEETQLQEQEFESAREEWLSLPPPVREEWLKNAGKVNPFLAANSAAGLELLAVELFRQERARSPTA